MHQSVTARDLMLIEEARHFANLYAHATELQVQRMSQLSREHFPLSWFSDFEFLLVALRKLRRSAELVQRIPAAESDIRTAIDEFDAALPWLVDLRNASEHFDEHLEGKDRRKSLITNYPSLFSTLLGTTGGVEWLGKQVDFRRCLDASHRLFEAVRAAHRKLAES